MDAANAKPVSSTLIGNTRAAAAALGFLSLLSCVTFLGCSQEQPTTPRGVRERQAALAPRAAAQNIPAPIGNKPLAAGSKLPSYELKLSARDLARMEANPFSDDLFPATFSAHGELFGPVQIRHRGAWARTWPKKPLKVFFEDGKPFEGNRRLNLNSCWRDPAFIREHLAYQVFAACGVPASKTRMVRLRLNNQFWGLFVEVEQVDKVFLNRNGLKGAVVFKASSRANRADERDLGDERIYRQHYERETGKDEDYGLLRQFCRELNNATNVFEFFMREVDVDSYVSFLVATVLVQNWDGFNKNHFLVFDAARSKKWMVVPWDLDRTFGDHWNQSFNEARMSLLLGTRQHSGVTGWNRMADRFFSEEKLRDRFLDQLTAMLEIEFTSGKLFPVLDRLEAELAPTAADDRERWPGPAGDIHDGIAQLKDFIKQRRVFLKEEAGKLRRGKPIADTAVSSRRR